MGIFQKAIRTFDTLKELESGALLPEGREPLGDIGCRVTGIDYVITLGEGGKFVSAARGGGKLPVPVTEKSEARTSGACAHPLCDQVCYLAPDDKKRHPLFMESIRAFADYVGDPRLDAIAAYLEAGTVKKDLEALEAGLAKAGRKPKRVDPKAFVYWRFRGLDDDACGGSLIRKFQEYYMDTVVSKREKALCMLTGRMDYPTRDHPKSVLVTSGNGKMISAGCEDDPARYLGRFRSLDEALTISYTASQKAHAALRWLCSNTGIQYGKTRTVFWDEGMHRLPPLEKPLIRGTVEENVPACDERAYAEQLDRAVREYMEPFGMMSDVCTASIIPSVKGRIAVSHYTETNAREMLGRLRDWDYGCSCMSRSGNVFAPGLYDIARYAYGIPSKKGTEVRDSDLESALPRLIACRTGGLPVPKDIKEAIADRAGRLILYPAEGGSSSQRERLLFTACSVIRKYMKDHVKEDYGMALEADRKDRSYQFGRLLAVFEKYEYDTYDEEDRRKRQTNALRLQSTFSQRPVYGMGVIKEQLQKGYAHKLSIGQRTFYEKLTGEIMEQLSGYLEEELAKPLEGTYLLGYYMQKNALYRKQDEAG